MLRIIERLVAGISESFRFHVLQAVDCVIEVPKISCTVPQFVDGTIKATKWVPQERVRQGIAVEESGKADNVFHEEDI